MALIKAHMDTIPHKVLLLLYLWNLNMALFVHILTCNPLLHKKLWQYRKPNWDQWRLHHFHTVTILISQLSGLPLWEKIYAKVFEFRLPEIQEQVKYLSKTLIIALFSMLWQSRFSISMQSLTICSRIITHANVCKWDARTNPICGFGITFCPSIPTTNWENRTILWTKNILCAEDY